jgi:hypothetical protein
MATEKSPIVAYEARLAAACWPIPMSWFKTAKAGFYSAIMLIGLWLILRMDLAPSTTQVGLVSLTIFLTVLFVEVKEIDIASGIAELTVSFDAADGQPDGTDQHDSDQHEDDAE